MTLKEQLKKYDEDYQDDFKLDRINLSDVQLKLPGLKGKWISRLMNHKADLGELYEIREDTIVQLTKKIKDESPVAINDIFASREAEKHELIIKTNKEINTQKNIIEYLEKLEKAISSITYDIKNECELIKQETM
jgi:hypothetical protein